VSDRARVGAALAELSPWAIVNAAGLARPDAAEQRPELCRRANTDGPMVLADACSRAGIRLVTFSSDHVFDGAQQRPYVEADPVRPRTTYGQCQAEAERYVLAAYPDAMIVRTSALFGADGLASGLLADALHALWRGMSVQPPRDAVISPTYVGDLVTSCLDLLIDGASGLWHLANVGAVSPPAFLRQVAALAGLQPEMVQDDDAQPASPPRYHALGSQRGQHMPALDDALARWWHAFSKSVAAGRAA
jgi:dTDP-4-dehydrorhamnose reductase